jgi:hypothetical protein
VFNKDVKVPLQEAELVGTSSPNNVIRVRIKGPFDPPDAKEPDPPPFGSADSPYISFDDNMVACAPILMIDLTSAQLLQDVETLKRNGPFE